jgi:acetyl-CoA carboxylase carboxyl transferase subunit alpha
MPDALDFEQPLLDIENRIAALQAEDNASKARDEIAKLEERLARLRQRTYASLTAWQRTQLARHPKRPHTRDFIKLLFEDFVELHGDRLYGDDAAMVGGLARFEDQGVVVIGHQKGRDTREKIARNFGMPHPEGYRKALRLMHLAQKFAKPVLTFIDTPGAYPGLGAEERGQAEAIARNLREMAALRTPILSVVTGEGGSGGALAIGMGNRVLMLEYAIYSVISPEGCAAILWGDAAKAPEAAESMRITAPDLLRLGVIDAIVPEPVGGAHRDWESAAGLLREALRENLRELAQQSADDLVAGRYEKFRRIGAFEETSVPVRGT